MARIWSAGAEIGHQVFFVGGIQDGGHQFRADVPPEIYFPLMPNQIKDGDDGRIISPRLIKYKRVSDTLNYVCVNWYP